MMQQVDDRLTYAERVAALSVGPAVLDLTAPRPLKLTVADLVMLDRHWQDDDHKSTELIDGCIYFTPARYMPRGRIVQEIWHQLREAAAISAPHLFVGMRGSIEVSPYDLPLPDIVLTSEADGEGFIPAASVPLVVEVADAAVDFYMSEKMRLYALAGVPEYWVADVMERAIYQMWQPSGDVYSERLMILFGRQMNSMITSGLRLETDEL